VLTDELRFLFRTLERSEDNHVVVLQSRYVVALSEYVAPFLRRAGVGDDIADRFVELADAIGGLRLGIVTDPVCPATIDSRSLDSLTTWLLRGEVGIGLDCLIKSERIKTLKDAADHIAKKYPQLSRLKRNRNDTLASAILSWRNSIREGKAPESDYLKEKSRTYFKKLGALSPEAMFGHAKEVLAETAKKTSETASLRTWKI
jgi:hypothetical protein